MQTIAHRTEEATRELGIQARIVLDNSSRRSPSGPASSAARPRPSTWASSSSSP